MLDVVVSDSTDPAVNLALEDEMVRAVEAGARRDTLRLWINDECIVRAPRRTRGSGWHDDDAARRLGIPVHIRTTSGGTVYQDHGNLNWSFYLQRSVGYVGARKLFPLCAGVIAEALGELGIEARFGAPNRIDVAGHKISGLAARASLGAVLVHGTLLVSTDIARLNAVCIPPLGCPPVARLCDLAPEVTLAAVVRSIARCAADHGASTVSAASPRTAPRSSSPTARS